MVGQTIRRQYISAGLPRVGGLGRSRTPDAVNFTHPLFLLSYQAVGGTNHTAQWLHRWACPMLVAGGGFEPPCHGL